MFHIDSQCHISPFDLDAYFEEWLDSHERYALEVFLSVLRPLPTTTVLIASTPTGRGSFYDMWLRGETE